MNPGISIITATLNSSATVHDCLKSVQSQSVAAEQIVVDGGSADETVEIARSFSHVSKIVSEKDNGIYDAMNKGIALATGELIGILNADDILASHDVLGKVAKAFSDPEVDSCYGDLVYVDAHDTARVTRNWKSGTFRPGNFYWGWMPPHPTFFVRRFLYEKYGTYNLHLGTAADYELMLRFLVRYGCSASYIPEVLVRMRSGGASNSSLKNRLKANRMDRLAWVSNKLTPYPWTVYLKPLRKIWQFFPL